MSLRWIVAFSAAERQSEKGGPGTEKCAGRVLGSQGIRRAAGRTRRRPVKFYVVEPETVAMTDVLRHPFSLFLMNPHTRVHRAPLQR